MHYATASAPMVRACGRVLRSKEIKNNEKRINLFGKIFGPAKNHGNKK
ncbi:MAG: hypothetical protein ABSB10_04225 [Candidatus Bathyarchaeia archaeon]